MTIPTKMIQIPFYWALIGIASVILSPVLAIFASVQIANNNTEQLVEQTAVERAKTVEQSRLDSCALTGKLIDTYEETPPITPSGKAVEQAYRDFYAITLQCQPRKKQ